MLIMSSFQATKIFSTVDGGMVTLPDETSYKRAKLLRWYGIDRETGKPNINVDIKEAGYKYHMNDVTAAMGIAGLGSLVALWGHQVTLNAHYVANLRKHGIEAGLMHRRNDTYSVFGGKRQKLPTMNRIEDKYLFLPLHHAVTEKDVKYISKVIKGGW